MASLTPSLPEKAFEATETDTFASLASSLSVTVIPPFFQHSILLYRPFGALSTKQKKISVQNRLTFRRLFYTMVL
jgi:hypothetical protein